VFQGHGSLVWLFYKSHWLWNGPRWTWCQNASGKSEKNLERLNLGLASIKHAKPKLSLSKFFLDFPDVVRLGLKSSQDASERIGIKVERCGSPVRDRIELETRENTSIRVDFVAGGSRAHGNVVTPCLWLEIDEAGSEWRRNRSRSVAFDAGTFLGGK